MIRKLPFILLACVSLPTSASAEPDAIGKVPATAYLASYFQNRADRDGLFLAWSPDGLEWNELNGGRSILKPTSGEEKRMRDPYILQGPDGTFHLVFTTGMKGKTIGYSSSTDLLNWTEQKTLSLMGDYPTTLNCWAPAISYDESRNEFLIYWASSVPDQFPNHRLYAVRTKDFSTFTKPEILFNPGYLTIDATIEPADGRFYLFYKGDKPVAGKIESRIYFATADQVGGPYTEQGPAIPNDGAECPAICKVGDAYHFYVLQGYNKPFSLLRSTDMKSWTDITGQLRMPPFAGHSRIFPVSGEIVKNFIRHDLTTGSGAKPASTVTGSPVRGNARTWEGNTDSNFATAANWKGNGIPLATDLLIFDGPGTSGTTLTNGLAAGLRFGGITFGTKAGAYALGGKSITLGGDLTNNSINLQTINLDIALSAASAFNAASGNIAVDGVISGVSELTKTGPGTLTVSGENTYSGATSVGGGTLMVNNTAGSGLGTGNVTVGSNATLGGTGAFTGDVTVHGGGTLAPGDGVQTLAGGALSLDSHSIYFAELDSLAMLGTEADLFVVNGNLKLAEDVELRLSDVASTPTDFSTGKVFSLINYTGTWNNGLFTTGGKVLANGEKFTVGPNTWMITYNSRTGGDNFPGDQQAGNFVNLTAVSESGAEPGALGMSFKSIITTVALLSGTAGLGALGTVIMLRRRKSA